ncbi:metallophosphoesterase family protein [Caulobacter sp.]|uniref:metallophosphoesterase family protein n=1 Tax=Caulobacter sp. TaxID=78 RepID=UPI003BAA0EFF
MNTLARKRPQDAEIPPNTLVYAVGDIHGRLDLLDRLIDWVAEDCRASRADVARFIIFLGDYVDRGPSSKGVIDRLLSLSIPGLSVIALRGNHEQMMLDVLDAPDKGPGWARVGGNATLMSYGVKPPAGGADPAAWVEAVDALRAAMPPSHVAFLRGLKPGVEFGDFFFVHAGIRPGRPIHAQTEQDLLWIRERFLNHKGSFERVIVHGHSTDTAPMVNDYRIGVDTGAYATGVLTCLRLDGRDRMLFGVKLGGVGLWS